MRNKNEVSKILAKLSQNSNGNDFVTISELNNSLEEFGFGLVMLIFALPMSLPIPYPPGLTTLFGLPLFFASFQMLLGLDSHWLPNWLGKKTIKRTRLADLVEKSNPYVRKVELFIHPRLHFMTSDLGNRITGLICFACSICIVLPILFGNLVPALGISFMSLGLLKKDGLLILSGMAIGIIGILVTISVVMFDTIIIEDLINFIK